MTVQEMIEVRHASARVPVEGNYGALGEGNCGRRYHGEYGRSLRFIATVGAFWWGGIDFEKPLNNRSRLYRERG
jgi:hypothetical protein